MGAAPPTEGPRLPVQRVLARLTTPIAYLGVLGTLQVALLWLFRPFFGIWPAALALVMLVLLLVLLRQGHDARPTLWLGAAFVVLVAIVPTVIGATNRPRLGITTEHDGLIQIEAAVDRVMHGQPIYGVDWSATPLASMPWSLTPGPNPALHHLAYFPLTVLAGVPARAVTDLLGVPFDYRYVLLACVLVGMAGVTALPIGVQRRFLLLVAVYASPLITLYLWSGRTDTEFLGFVFLSLALLVRGRVGLASLALGVAVAFKPFAAFAVPFLLVIVVMRWRNGGPARELLGSLALLAATPILTIAPFLFADPGAFWRDTVLYTSGGVPDAYPIAGYGFGALLVGLHVVGRRTDAFPFGVFQLAAMLPALGSGVRRLLVKPTVGRWMAGYATLFLAFALFGRFFNDNYAALALTLFLCVLPLGEAAIPVRAHPQRARLAA